ncbi:MAG: (2Fe-2S) ferredoxin domain-containing protein [Bdellovibrionaceae bacterium]|nr:(2Fe-2S) ferredoxin domain-containing protein [Pseudobdellovibrionaceae bacterium]
MSIENQKTPWQDGIFLICEKCGKSLDGLKLKESGNASDNLKKYLKSELKDRGYGKRIRVINSGCLDVCIKDAVAVSYIPVDTSVQRMEVSTVHPEEDRERILKDLLKRL